MGSIILKTYSDPNHALTDTGLERNCLHITPMQEMIQGFRSIEMYAADPREGGWQLMTAKTLVNAFYDDWFGGDQYSVPEKMNDTRLRQCMEVGEMLAQLVPGETFTIRQTGCEDKLIAVDENLKHSLEHNTMQMTDTLRLLTALNLPPDGIPLAALSMPQQIAVYLYQQTKHNLDTSFQFKRRKTRASVQEALDKAVEITAGKRYARNPEQGKRAVDGYRELCSSDTIIFDSIFQLTPELLQVIFDLKNAGYTVYLIFNYRTEQELRPFFQCWLDMYSMFGCKESILSTEMRPPVNQQNYRLAAALGTLLNGGYPKNCKEIAENTSFLEFESVTEFANYVDNKFSAALKREQLDKQQQYQNTLHYLDEMVYATSREATSILRVYHPQQFGDRTLYDFPMGKALTAMIKMWDPETHMLEIRDFGYLGDCLRGLPDSDSLKNINTYQILRPYLENLTTLDDVVHMVRLLMELNAGSSDTQQHFANLSMYQCSTLELESLYDALDKINQMAHLLFEQNEQFDFYQGLRAVLEQLCSEETADYNMDAKSLNLLLKKARETVNAVSDYDRSFSPANKQLTVMLDQILQVTETESSSAKWIIHDLVQVDGDILVNPAPGITRTNHFAFLSDQDFCSSTNDALPWPLDMQFFKNIQLNDNANTLLRIFLKARQETRNFPKYALVYGILFSREPVVLSYVRNVNGEEREPYYLFRMLGLKPHRISLEYSKNTVDPTPYVVHSERECMAFDSNLEKDRNIAQICTFRYVTDCLIKRKTWYADRFSIIAYIKTYLISLVLYTVHLFENNRLIPGNRDEVCYIIAEHVKRAFSEEGNTFQKLEEMGILTPSEIHEIQHDVLYQSQSRGLQILESIANDPRTPAQHFKNIVKMYQKNTQLYPCDSVFFEDKTHIENPKQLWTANAIYSRYEDFHYKNVRDGESKGNFNCSLCPCKPFCSQGILTT